MIKIDGEKIKKLREEQGLTQLYMAAAVEVTTDTISRWENKRYPTIKQENAAKLAEALGVALEDILLKEDSPSDAVDADTEVQSGTQRPPLRRHRLRQRLLLLGLVILIGVSLIPVWVYYHKSSTPSGLRAVRIMPPRTIPGMPFPVVVEISHNSSTPTSIIIKEFLPEGCKVLQVSPPDGSATGTDELKWISKLQGTQRFSYLASIEGAHSTAITFSGTVSTARSEGSINVAGKKEIALGRHHWADLDADGSISDQEILVVFDYYSDIDDFVINIEFIEKMWLGSHYSWDEENNQITITP